MILAKYGINNNKNDSFVQKIGRILQEISKRIDYIKFMRLEDLIIGGLL